MNLKSQDEIIKRWKGSIAEPLVSIICLAYNYERFLPQAIEEVLMQETDFPFELLIGVNPGSDNTPEVARRYAQRYPLIVKAVIREENIGAHKNFKDIRSRAKGKYIAHCDADDYWTDPSKLQKQYEILESNKSCAITFHEVEVHDFVYRQNYYFVNERNRKIYTLQDLCYKNFIPAPSIFYRNYSFDLPDEIEEIQASDWAYFILLAEKGDIYYLPDCMAVYRKHSSGVWGNMDRQLMAIKSIESMIQIDELSHGKHSKWISIGMVKRLELYGIDQDILEKYRDKIKAKTYEICRYIISEKEGVTDYRNYQEENKVDHRDATQGVECPICGSRFKEFLPFGTIPKPNALCPICHSLEHHRLLWLYLKRKTNLFTDKLKVLDIAPTKGLSDNIRALPNIDYMSIDLNSKLAIKHMDITNIDFPDNTFDCVICYHVLEHIPNDKKSISDIFRVMKPGGWAIIQVPINKESEKTIEGVNIADPSERKRLFGQEEHVRYYGLDYKDRLESVGFKVKVDDFASSLTPDEIKRYAIFKGEDIYLCIKPAEGIKNIYTDIKKDVQNLKGSDELKEKQVNKMEFSPINNSKNPENEKIKVTFVAHGPNQVNGPNIWLQRILPELRKKGFAPEVIFMMFRPEPCQVALSLQKEGFKCHLIPWAPYTELNIVNILRVLKSNAPDIFVPNLSIPAYYASRWVRSAGIPTVGVLHSDDNFHHEIVDYFLAGEPVWRLSGIVCVSRFLETMVKSKTEQDIEICMAPCGVPFPSQKSKAPKDELHIIYAGRLIERQKRIFNTIESLRNVVTKIPNTYVTIYGHDFEGGKVIELIKSLKLGKKLRYGGIYDPKDLFYILPQYHVFVLLSEYEGMPIALMEAMACGLVPVCTKVRSGVSEIIKNNLNGLLVGDNELELIKAIHRLRTEKGLWERLSEKARETIKEAYTIEICADRWSMFLRKLTESSGEKKEISVPDPYSINLPPIKVTENGISREDNMRLPKPSGHESSVTSYNEFINPPNTFDFIDRYIIRNAIKEAIVKYMFLLSGTLLDVGCGQMPYKEFILKNNPNVKKYIGLDFAEGKYARLKKPDLTWDGHTIPLMDSTVDCVMTTEVLEHCEDPLRLLKEIRRVLIPGGVFLFTTPFIWPLHDTPGDYYRYTPFSLKKLLSEAGFEDIEIKPLGGWHATFAQMIGLWIKRAPIPEETRRNVFRDLNLFYSQLLEAAKGENIQAESENTITPGWIGLAYTTPRPSNKDNIISPAFPDKSLKICLFRHEYFAYSQTFIEDHIAYLGPNITVIHGETLPMFNQKKECILSPAFFDAIKGLPPDRIHSVYTKFLADYLRKEQFDVVLAEFGVVGAKIYKACQEASVSYVVHFHGYDAHVHDIIKQYEKQYREMFQGAFYLVAVSKVMQEKLISLGAPPEKVILNPYGVSVTTHDMANPEMAPPIFLAVGRFVEKKGPHLTIQAFKKVVSAVPEARLIMVGDGPLLEHCQNLSKNLGIEDHIIFAGVHNRRSVGKFMSHSRAFVQHSLTTPNGDSEGLPVAILEAGAQGLPVVSTRHAGIMDAVVDGEHGFLVDEENWLEMAEAMIVLAKNPKLAGFMGKKFRQRTESMYSTDHSIAGLRKILAKAAKRDETFSSRRTTTIPQNLKESGEKTTSNKASNRENHLLLEKELVSLTLRKDFKKIIAIAKVEPNKTPLVEYLLGNAYLQEGLPEEALKCWERVIGYEDTSLLFVRPRFEQLKNHPDLVMGKNLLYEGEPRVHVLILTMNRKYFLEKTFKCLGKTDYRNYKVFLLDNCSSDGTREILPRLKTFLPKHVDFVFDSLPTNIGRPGGHNWMLTYWDHSDAQFIAILDDDLLYFKPNWLKLFLNTFALGNNIAAVGSKTLQSNGTIQDAFPIISDTCNYTTVSWFTHRDEQDIGQHDFITNIPDYVTGCFSVFKKEIFDKVGLFDIRYSPSQCVDIDHSIRIRKAGYDIFYNGNISVVHAQLTHEEKKKNKGIVANAVGNAYKLVNKFDKTDWDNLINKRILREKTFWETYITRK